MISRSHPAPETPRALVAAALICLISSALSSGAILMPDLVVTDFAEKDGVISFTLKNVGTKIAPTGHTTTLSVDGKQVDSVLHTVTIAPDKTYTTTFKKYQWNCTSSGKRTLVVAADSSNKVAEIDEKNNSRQETWTCDATAPVITSGPQVMYITQTSAKVSWTTNEDSDSAVRYGTTSGTYKYTESMAVSTTNHAIFLDTLLPDTLYYYVVESTDDAGNTVRSTQRSFRTLADTSKKPDLIVVEIWEQDAEVLFRLRNTGAATAPSGHTTALYVDGQLKATQRIAVALAAGAQVDSSFPYTWQCTKPQHAVKVVADSAGAVEEESETNNSREETWTCDVTAPKILSGPTVSGITPTAATVTWSTDEKSDSAVRYGTQPGAYPSEKSDNTLTDKHQVQLLNLKAGTACYFVVRSRDAAGNTVTSTERSFRTQVEAPKLPDLIIDSASVQDHTIWFTVKNAGPGPAAAGHQAGLYISDRLVDATIIGRSLNPGEVLAGSFEKFYFECFDPEHTFRVTADIENRVPETDETNNSLHATVACDVAGPKITSGPFASVLSGQSASISWTTDKPCDSNVAYDDQAGVFEHRQGGTQPTMQHRIALAGLTPGMVYQFQVRSTDSQGRAAVSRPGYFRTNPKADAQRPRISNLTFVRQATKRPYYKIAASADDDTGVEMVQFFVDGLLLHTDYAAPYEATFAPGMLGMMAAEFYRPHTIEALAFDGGMMSSRVAGLGEPVHDCNDVHAEFEWPFPDETFYVPGTTTGSDTEIPIQVYALTWDMRLVFSGGGVEAPPGHSGEIWDIVELPVQEVRFSVNGTPIGTIPSRDNHLYPITWRPVDLPLGNYVLRADAVANDTCIQTITRDIRLQRGAPELELTRRVWREENAFRIELTVRNAGTVSYFCDQIRDNLDGLQALAEARDTYYVRTDLSADGRECTVDLDLFGDASATWEIRPGRSISAEYLAIPVQLPGPGATHYAIGEDPVRLTTEFLGDPWRLTRSCVRTESGRRLADEIESAIAGSDYLIVTNPDNCQSEFFLGADDVFAQMATLAYHRNGILGYALGIGSGDPATVRGWILAWGAGMKGSDGVAGNYLSNGYLLLVGEAEILPAWTVDVTDIVWGSDDTSDVVGYSDLPYGDTQGADNVPELITARLIGDSDAVLIQAMQAGLASTFDRSYGLVTSGSEGETENFVGSARDIYTTWVGQGAGGEIMTDSPNAHHWSTHIQKEQMNNGHDFPMNAGEGFVLANLGGTDFWALRLDPAANMMRGAAQRDLDLVRTTFSLLEVCPFDPGDALAAGDLDGDGKDEVVVGSLAGDQIIVAYDTPGGRQSFSATLEPWDVLACGPTEGTAQEQIVLARTTGGGTIRIYEYDNSGVPSLNLLRTFPVPFTTYDGLAVGDVNATSPGAEILVGSDEDDVIRVYSNTGTVIAELPCPLYSPFDSLTAGDFDGDGVDEIAVLVDDEIDSKRRLVLIQNDGWTTDGAGGWTFKRNKCSTIHSRFLNFEGARTTGSDTRQDGVACGDLDGDGREEIAVARESSDRLLVLDAYYADGWNDRYVAYLQDRDERIDILTMRGHGNPGTCSPLDNVDVNELSFDAHPLVFVLSCLTGNYEGDWSIYDPNGDVVAHNDGDDGFAENFFARGAAVYIGATEVSPSGQNTASGTAFFTQWDPAQTAGKAFRDYRRNRAATGDATWEYWAMEYNYYGDPKFGALGAPVAAAAVAAPAPMPGLGEQVTIPDYEVKTVDGKDHVTIPGGDVLLENGQPMVPCYSMQWELPPGTVVQDVRVRQRSELRTALGLVLPLATLMQDAAQAPLQAARDRVNKELPTARGWYPAKDLDWRLIPGSGGSSTLIVRLYPFFYNAQTTEVRFYRHYVLDVEVAVSGVQIAALSTDKRLYQPADTVTVSLGLSATGQAADVIVEVVIRRYGSDEIVAGLLLRRLSGLSGSASYSAAWDSTGAVPGVYYAQTRIATPAGQVLDQQACLFTVGGP
ncbi:MAG: fibronectin type III domain-containing protein [Planctomycetes bacterium]|nr:fibronectin type III domain-containing protein [Planctomycetota bacterium]